MCENLCLAVYYICVYIKKRKETKRGQIGTNIYFNLYKNSFNFSKFCSCIRLDLLEINLTMKFLDEPIIFCSYR